MKVKKQSPGYSVFQPKTPVARPRESTLLKTKVFLGVLVAACIAFMLLSIESENLTIAGFTKNPNLYDNAINLTASNPENMNIPPIAILLSCTEAWAEMKTSKTSGDKPVGVKSATTESEGPNVTLPIGEAGAATNLRAEAFCDPDESRKGMARLSWTIAAKPGSEQRVAVTTYIRSFEIDASDTTWPVPPDQDSFVYKWTSPGIVHYWRVLTLHKDVWIPSETADFEGAVCVEDFVPTPEKSDP